MILDENTNFAPRIVIETITPEIAVQLREHTTGNFRKLNPDVARRYARDMINGEWELNGETIKIIPEKKIDGSIKWVVGDGQHRLQAVAIAGVPVKMAVAYNLPGSMLGVDTGWVRKIPHWLNHMGYKNCAKLTATAKLCIQYEQGKWFRKQLSVEEFTNQEVIEYVVEHSDLLESALSAARRYGIPLLQLSSAAVIMLIGSGRITDPMENETCSWFWRSFKEGEMLSAEDPVFLLRSRMIKSRSAQAHKISPYYARLLATLAWNKTVRGESLKNLQIQLTGPYKTKPPNEILIAK